MSMISSVITRASDLGEAWFRLASFKREILQLWKRNLVVAPCMREDGIGGNELGQEFFQLKLMRVE